MEDCENNLKIANWYRVQSMRAMRENARPEAEDQAEQFCSECGKKLLENEGLWINDFDLACERCTEVRW